MLIGYDNKAVDGSIRALRQAAKEFIDLVTATEPTGGVAIRAASRLQSALRAVSKASSLLSTQALDYLNEATTDIEATVSDFSGVDKTSARDLGVYLDGLSGER